MWDSPDVHPSVQPKEMRSRYARYLGVDIESSSYLKSLFKIERYQMQFEETIHETVEQTVSELVKADEYFVSYEVDAEGVPLWTAYVLLRISNETVVKHQLALREEAKRKAQEPDAPEKPDEWIASLYNIDDSVSVFVNGTKINQCDFSQNCKVKLTPHLNPGQTRSGWSTAIMRCFGPTPTKSSRMVRLCTRPDVGRSG